MNMSTFVNSALKESTYQVIPKNIFLLYHPLKEGLDTQWIHIVLHNPVPVNPVPVWSYQNIALSDELERS